MAQRVPVAIKGTLNGLFINVDSTATYDDVLTSLKTQLNQSSAFYKGAKIIGINGIKLTYKQKYEIEEMLVGAFGLQVESLELQNSNEPTVDFPKKAPQIEKQIVEVTKTVQVPVDGTKFVYGTMRSGKSVKFAGNVVVIGDVNPGAEIVAEGNIIVLGRVLGFVHAGSAGDEQAMIVANLLKPTQIRIAKFISVPPSDDHGDHVMLPERAIVSEGNIKIEKIH